MRMPAPKKRIRNRLNDLDPKAWLKFQKSWFIHNPPPRRKDVLQHPAKFPETLAQEFIEFFTKKGQTILDPMVGTGSTLVACLRAKRNGIGIELNPKYAAIARQSVEDEKRRLYKRNAKKPLIQVIEGDAAQVVTQIRGPIDFVITSPPYWDMLHAHGAETQKKRRAIPGLDVFYSDDPRDLGNVRDYGEFVERLAQIYEALHPVLKERAYLTVIVKNVKKGGKIYPLAWDLAKRLSQTYTLKDEKLWCLPPEERIWTERGLIPIGEIQVGERVLTHTGYLESVTQVMRREHHGPCLAIKPALLGQAVRLTPGHEVLVVKRQQYQHANGERFHESFERSYARGPLWIPAEQICEGDTVAFPVPQDELNTQGLSTSNFLESKDNWLDREDAQRIRAALGFKSKTVRYNRSQHWLRDGLIWLPVREVLKETFSGEVCNLAVANANSYVARSFIVHNCQDNQRLAPYGLGNAWVSNTFHHYCLQFRKE